MTAKHICVAATALLLASTDATFALAQARGRAAPAARAPTSTAAPSPSAPPLNHGPPITGICVYSTDRALAASSVGRAMSARLQQLAQQARAELQAEAATLQNEEKTFESRRNALTADQQRQQAAPLAQREQVLQQKAAVRQRELQLTQERALQRIAQNLEPIVRSIYQSQRCSLLLSGDGAVLAANPAMDITDQAAQQLNTRMPSISFDREQLPPGQQ